LYIFVLKTRFFTLEGFKENDISRELMGRSDPNEKLFIGIFWVYLSYPHYSNLFRTVPEKINSKDEISIFFKSRYVE